MSVFFTLSGLEILEISKKHPEPNFDVAYEKEASLSLDESLVRDYQDLIRSISDAWNGLRGAPEDGSSIDEAVIRLVDVLRNEDLKHCEFVSFWPILDISYSQYQKFAATEKRTFMRQALVRFLECRYELYAEYGFSPASLQAGLDRASHKTSGTLGQTKMIRQIRERLPSIGREPNRPIYYLLPDHGDKKRFLDLLVERNIRFDYSHAYQGKLPDLCVVGPQDSVVVVEHKHLKEAGGGQDKQVGELIDFIKQSHDPPCVHYVSYLDGAYFNALMIPPNRRGETKLNTQQRHVVEALTRSPQNAFVNTAGFAHIVDMIAQSVGTTKAVD